MVTLQNRMVSENTAEAGLSRSRAADHNGEHRKHASNKALLGHFCPFTAGVDASRNSRAVSSEDTTEP
jgi:hypothetical protein